ncbi:hypothetical protein [Ensifer soli]|uniref:hypothetical protein n=1 Tax=Ciceribacter sp. sgz301302 TaxID=3342379 RepID=UPI0035BB9D32
MIVPSTSAQFEVLIARQAMENPLEQALFRSRAEHRVPETEFIRTIAPVGPDTQLPHHGLEKQAIVKKPYGGDRRPGGAGAGSAASFVARPTRKTQGASSAKGRGHLGSGVWPDLASINGRSVTLHPGVFIHKNV